MDETTSISAVTLLKAAQSDMERINRFALEPLSAEQVFTFKVNACDDQIDRDNERFTPQTLRQLAKLYIGKTVIFDHKWSAEDQTARIYDAAVVEEAGVTRLQVMCYMLQNDRTQSTIDAINGGILREVSVGCAIGKRTCSICGGNYSECGHKRGERYGGAVCSVLLEDATDAYELSFVAVPAQPGAGVTKNAGVQLLKTDAQQEAAQKHRNHQTQRAKARLQMYQKFI